MKRSLLVPLLLLTTSPGDAGELPRLLHSNDRPRLLASEAGSELPLPIGVDVEALFVVEGGYLLAGVRRDEAGEQPLLVRRSAAGEAELALPIHARHATAPAPLIAAGRLEGAAWLEGDGPRSMAVRAASWNGSRWSSPATVAPAGPGSQLALSAAVLADGRWILVWSAHDGQDDEILWAAGSLAGTFGAPQRLTDNDVPDITPAVLAAGSGALVAWSQYDGNDYRLHTARLKQVQWSTERVVAGRGAFAPTWHPRPGQRPLLLVRDSEVQGWRLMEIDARGALHRQAVVAAPPDERPAPDTATAGLVRLLWADGRVTETEWTAVAQ